uniref:protein-glutamine gamma-glutamyltransferase n=1 Tax=Hirondellea gigas TaxID=1518452 RepID=A0A2P2HW15_9CRUS
MSRNRYGAGYNNWLSSLRADTARSLNRRIRNESVEDDKTTEINRVDRIHFYIKDNAKQHNTIKFDQIHDEDSPKPVLRRGQTFYVAIRFKERNYDAEKDRVILNFLFGPRPSVTKSTLAVLPVVNRSFTRTKDEWDVRIDPGTRAKDLVLQVYIPASAPVGIWKLNVRTGLVDRSVSRATVLHSQDTDIFVLFNPWCKDDNVYMEDDAEREEYIMNDRGKVYVGQYRKARGRPWAFGQFDDVVLPAAVYILEMRGANLTHSERGNPVKVVRAISAGVNASDDDGILEGNWSGDYSGGTPPFKWTGSVRILEEFIKQGHRPVKYGQCWVFSTVVTTICRALGIPCRSVTNFVSAHDTNSTLTVDKFFTKAGDEIEGGPDGDSYDSIWNFHVWNDVWMARPDLPKGYGGWQAIDSTPQEESDNKMQCGPASLEAIRRGDVGLNYDCTFVFAEVNADIMHWGEDDESDWGFTRLKLNKFHVGRMVMTKKVGDDGDDEEDQLDRTEVTDSYKNREGTAAERLSVHNAVRGTRRAQRYYAVRDDIVEDCAFDLHELENIKVGESFKVNITVRNESDETRTVIAALTARSIYYTGVNNAIIKKAEGKIVLGPKQEQELALTITYREYWRKLVEHCFIKMYAICRVVETQQTWTEEDDFQITKPALNIDVPTKVTRGQKVEAVFSFTNPLDEELTECSLSVDGSGLLRPRAININSTVPPGGEFIHKFEFVPRIQGERKLIVSFSAKELFDISGSKTITVGKRE